LVVHSPPTPIPPLCTWTNNVRDNRESIVGPYFFNNIIGPRKQEWDRSGIRVYNQAFLFLISIDFQFLSSLENFNFSRALSINLTTLYWSNYNVH
jgi:hypothetical protein